MLQVRAMYERTEIQLTIGLVYACVLAYSIKLDPLSPSRKVRVREGLDRLVLA